MLISACKMYTKLVDLLNHPIILLNMIVYD